MKKQRQHVRTSKKGKKFMVNLGLHKKKAVNFHRRLNYYGNPEENRRDVQDILFYGLPNAGESLSAKQEAV